MNSYTITYRFAGGSVLTCTKVAKSVFSAKQQLWAQLGQSRRIEILAIKRTA